MNIGKFFDTICSWNRLKFYFTLLIATILVMILAAQLPFLGCGGSECFGLLGAILGLFIILKLIIIFGNIALIISYEVKNWHRRKKSRFIMILYCLILLSAIIGPSLMSDIKEELREKELSREISELYVVMSEKGYGGCVEISDKNNYPFSEHNDNEKYCSELASFFQSQKALNEYNKSICADDTKCLELYSIGGFDYESTCNMLNSRYVVATCFDFFAEKSSDEILCDHLFNSPDYPETNRAVCIKKARASVKKSTSEIEFCNHIEDQFWREDCVITKSLDFNDCFDLTLIDTAYSSEHNSEINISNKDKCIVLVAYRLSERAYDGIQYNGNVDICYNISSLESFKISCISALATSPDDCFLITKSFDSNMCLVDLAQKSKNVSVCSYIMSDSSFTSTECELAVNAIV